MIGQRFGKLTVVASAKPAVRGNGRPLLRYRTVCDCGRKVTVHGNNLRNGNTRSCGCIEIKPPGLFRLKRKRSDDA